MSIQINPYISALQETQKAPVSKTQEKSVGKKYQSFGRSAEAFERGDG